jgi:hypothetical protein
MRIGRKQEVNLVITHGCAFENTLPLTRRREVREVAVMEAANQPLGNKAACIASDFRQGTSRDHTPQRHLPPKRLHRQHRIKDDVAWDDPFIFPKHTKSVIRGLKAQAYTPYLASKLTLPAPFSTAHSAASTALAPPPTMATARPFTG